MHVMGSTTYRLARGTLRESPLLGALLAVTLLALLAAPCERGLCDRPGIALPSQVQTVSSDAQLPPFEAPAHCTLHCGLLLFSLPVLTASPPRTARVPQTTLSLRLRLTPPPLLPPPQLA